uniref:Uncharacterized protein n=1 Tax=Mus musculus TaxID=10090 RepID=Q6R5F3_MOUSE|nr:unknown [Mus musculus]
MLITAFSDLTSQPSFNENTAAFPLQFALPLYNLTFPPACPLKHRDDDLLADVEVTSGLLEDN